jgi:signal transduction histidine kinase
MLLLGLQLIALVFTINQHRQKIKQAHRQLQEYAKELETLAAIKERNRFAYEFYDALGHSLAALNIQLQTADTLLHIDLEQAQKHLVQANQIGCNTMQEVRQAVKTLGKDAKLPSNISLSTLNYYLSCTHTKSEVCK